MDPNPRQTVKRFSRRRLLLGAGGVAGGVVLDAFALEPAWLEVTEHIVPIPSLSRALDGFCIAQISDAHLAKWGRVESSLVRAISAARANLVVLSGDIVDRPESLSVLSELVPALRAGGAEVVAVFGNWEHWAGFDALRLSREYEKLGARLLVDEAAVVAGVAVLGTDDGYAGAPRWDRSLASLGAVVGTGAPRVLVSHSPAMFERLPVELPAFDLCLSGHTHGGQLRLGSFAPFLPPGSGRFVKGSYDTPAGRLYVSRGTGTSVIAARFACRPELPLFRFITA